MGCFSSTIRLFDFLVVVVELQTLNLPVDSGRGADEITGPHLCPPVDRSTGALA